MSYRTRAVINQNNIGQHTLWLQSETLPVGRPVDTMSTGLILFACSHIWLLVIGATRLTPSFAKGDDLCLCTCLKDGMAKWMLRQ